MRKQYDFSKARRNPIAKRLKRQITIRIDASTIDYFKTLAGEVGISYQQLMNMYLSECALAAKRPKLQWTSTRN